MIVDLINEKGRSTFSVDDFEVHNGIGVVFINGPKRTLIPFTAFTRMSWTEENDGTDILPKTPKLFGCE